MGIINKFVLIKSIIYRFLSASIMMLFTFLITGNASVSASIGILDFFLKILIYYFYDIAYDKLAMIKLRPSVIWMTGLSGAGKTTIAKEIKETLTKYGNKVVILDGDEIREMFPTGFDEKSRIDHNKRVAYMAKLLKDQGSIVIVCLISPVKSGREYAKELCGDNFYETYISTSFDICEARDVKGLYARARAGEIKNFTGLDAVYDIPTDPDININTDGRTPKNCADEIIRTVRKVRR